ncbi:hypothetical protein AB0C77_08320 [Streptomyces sp. NPDC048629]|uniref:hypothetical protein n=1 Tax=Streptomyces sp. NPDC048629 TaxID=3154824 RepID=UPI00344103C3
MTSQPSEISLQGPHRVRSITFQGTSTVRGWILKVYSISAHTASARQELITAALQAAASVLPSPQTDNRHGVGFVIAHDAADYCFALVDWWQGENEIHQHMFSAPLESPGELRQHQTRAIGCVWELAVTDFERRAWLTHVLANPQGPDIKAYLNAAYEGTV